MLAARTLQVFPDSFTTTEMNGRVSVAVPDASLVDVETWQASSTGGASAPAIAAEEFGNSDSSNGIGLGARLSGRVARLGEYLTTNE